MAKDDDILAQRLAHMLGQPFKPTDWGMMHGNSAPPDVKELGLIREATQYAAGQLFEIKMLLKALAEK
jgi:hypothetical protein